MKEIKGTVYTDCPVFVSHVLLSGLYRLVKKKGIKISMGVVGNCYDNAIAERLNNRILKNEYLPDNEFASYAQAVRATREAIYLYN